MSLKPEVVRVRGVHSVTNSSQEGDIGFPQLQLEKLFEAATVKELAQGEPYNDKKKYAYLNPNWPETDPNKYLSIENKAHFYCVRDGYCGLDGSVDHYYTKEGDDYKYNAVPDTGSWDAKLEFSDAIKDKELYSISQEEERIYIDGQGYYKKENDSYKRQSDTVYDTFKKSGEVDWSEENKYICEAAVTKDEDGKNKFIYNWKNSDDINILAESGCYISVLKLNANTYKVQLLENVNFNEEGVWESNSGPSAAALYKLAEDDYVIDGNNLIYLYMKNGDKLSCFTEGEITFTYDPAGLNVDNSLYCMDVDPFVYPNYEYPYSVESIVLLADKNSGVWRSFDQADFPLFTGAALSGISKVPNAPHTVYEKLAVTVNYKYSDNNNLKFIFTNKSVDGVLEACNLKSTLPSKYVHLTNLEYSKNS